MSIHRILADEATFSAKVRLSARPPALNNSEPYTLIQLLYHDMRKTWKENRGREM